ncbi:hypothetical protein [Streptomyces canus]
MRGSTPAVPDDVTPERFPRASTEAIREAEFPLTAVAESLTAPTGLAS